MIDLSYYERVAEGDKDFMIQMVKTFIEDVPLIVEKIRFFYENDNLNDLAKQAHKLKASWSMTGLDVLLLESLEKEARSENRSGINEKVEKVEKIFLVAIGEMEARLKLMI